MKEQIEAHASHASLPQVGAAPWELPSDTSARSGRFSRDSIFSRNSDWRAYLKALLVVVACTAVAWLMHEQFAEANLVMVYLLGIVIVAARFGRGPSILTSIVSVAAFDFFFAKPYHTFAVSDVEYLVTFAIMMVVALVISTLTYRLRWQAYDASQREQRTAALYGLSRDLASTRGVEALLAAAAEHIAAVVSGRVSISLPDNDGRLKVSAAAPAGFEPDPGEREAAQRLFERSGSRGQELALAESALLHLPLVASRGIVGVMTLERLSARERLNAEQRHLLETLASQTALALERAYLKDETERTRIQIESEQLRNALLSSVSHDLRTPLATITGAASTLLEENLPIDDETRRDLTQSVYDEANRLNRLLSNLLDMTRLEAGGVHVRKGWYSIEELVGSALARLDSTLRNHPVKVRLPEDLPLVPLDELLIEQVLLNILDNAVKYTPPDSPIELSARMVYHSIEVAVADRGPGIAPGDEERIFDKFYRGSRVDHRQGAGLGLAIARAIIEAHGGTIRAENLAEGGASFRFTLPVLESAPAIAEEVLEVDGFAG